jgi:hypothetical protein
MSDHNITAKPQKYPNAPLDGVALTALVISSLLLLLAGERHPYSYYQMLRWVVTLSWLLAAWCFYRLGWPYMILFCAPFAIVFNPVSPIYMKRWQWRPYDEWTAVACVVVAIVLAWLSWRSRTRPAA